MIRTLKIGVILRPCINKISLVSNPIRLGRRYSSAFNICNYPQLCPKSTRIQMVDEVSKHEQGLLSGVKVDINKVIIRTNSNASDQTVSGDAVIVNHDPDGERFYIDIPGVGTATIDYERRDQLLVFKHTTVPSEVGGRGLGKILAKEALEYVAKHDLQLEIQCSFIRKYVSKYEPKYIKYVKKY